MNVNMTLVVMNAKYTKTYNILIIRKGLVIVIGTCRFI